MNINIENETYPRVGWNSETSRNMLLQKIFKFTTIFVGVVLSILITVDLGDKIFKTYNEDPLRILSTISSERTEGEEKTGGGNFTTLSELNGTSEDTQTPDQEVQNLIDRQKELLVNFYNKVDRQAYRGTWKSKEKFNFLSERTEGEIAFRVEKMYSYSTLGFEKVYFIFRLLDGHFIDRWAIVRSINRPFRNLTIGNTSIQQNSNSQVDYGEIFEKVDYDDDDSGEISDSQLDNINSTEKNSHSMASLNICKSTLNIDWSNNTQTTANLTNLSGSFSSNCGLNNFTFSLELEKEDEDYPKIMLYSVIVTCLALSQIFNTIWITIKISDSQTFANSISLITILQNIVWNAYGCLCHFFLTVNYDVRKINLLFFHFSIYIL